MSEKESEPSKPTNWAPLFRTVQLLFLGMFLLGISLCVGDVVPFARTVWNLPFSPFSIIVTTYGGLGYVFSGVLANKFEKRYRGEDV